MAEFKRAVGVATALEIFYIICMRVLYGHVCEHVFDEVIFLGRVLQLMN